MQRVIVIYDHNVRDTYTLDVPVNKAVLEQILDSKEPTLSLGCVGGIMVYIFIAHVRAIIVSDLPERPTK